jgi:hypothetical protein
MLSNRYFVAALVVGLVVVAAYNVRFFMSGHSGAQAAVAAAPAAPTAAAVVSHPQAVTPGCQAQEPPAASEPERARRWEAEAAELLARCDFSRDPFLGVEVRPLAAPRRQPRGQTGVWGPRLLGVLGCGEHRVAIIDDGSGSRVLAEGEWLGSRRLAQVGSRSVALVGREGRLRLELAE